MVDPRDYLFGLEQYGIKLGLDNIRAILAAMDQPQHTFDAVHVAGTNGKGSVTAMVEAAVRAAGARTGRYTSPHLVRLTERFAIDGVEVSEHALRQAVGAVAAAVQTLRDAGALDVHPTFFEVTTAAAFALFRSARVEIAICEVGLGGRLDSTNVLSPMATAITSIGVDHQQHLGSTLAEIAAEKAGIIKPGVPVVLGDLPVEAETVINGIARERAAPVVRARDGVVCQFDGVDAAGRHRVRIRTPTADYGRLTLALAGEHQVGNALVAIRVLEALPLASHPITIDAVRHGLATVEWPGRLQHVRRSDGRGALLDAAHNAEGAATLARFLAPSAPRPLVFAAMQDKDADGILRALAGTVSAIVVTRASHPRSAEPAGLADTARRVLGGIPCVVADSPADALERAWAMAPEIVVAGSIFLLGDILKALAAS